MAEHSKDYDRGYAAGQNGGSQNGYNAGLDAGRDGKPDDPSGGDNPGGDWPAGDYRDGYYAGWKAAYDEAFHKGWQWAHDHPAGGTNPGGTNPDGKDTVLVEPVAIQKFMADLKAVTESMDGKLKSLMTLQPILAGKFLDGDEIAKAIRGNGDSRAEKLYIVLGKLVNASRELHSRLNKAVTNYNNAEDLNKELAKDIDGWVQYLAGVLNLAPGAYNPGGPK